MVAQRHVVIRRLRTLLIAAVAGILLTVVGMLAFMRRDHEVRMVVTFAKPPPSAVWRLLTDHASEPSWLPAFGTVVRRADVGGQPVWTHTTRNGAFAFTVRTISVTPEQRYERILVRDDQPRNQSWDGRWVYELQPQGTGTVLRISEFGWTDGFPFFFAQRVFGSPDAFLKHYAAMMGRALNDPASIQILRSH